jgi:hypothetical protein
MTAPSLGGAPTRDSVAPYTNYRIALATAVLGGLGATLGWLVCLAFETRDRKLVQSIVVGSMIGYAVHWGEHYVRAAIHESRGDPAAHHGTSHPLRGLLWAAGGGFIALASEHLIAHMINEYLRPFLASLISLVPAGAIIGWTMNRGRKKDKNLVEPIVDGLFIGLVISVVTGILWAIAFGTVPWFALVAWWGLIGVGTHIITGTERNAVGLGDPIAAVVMVFVATMLINFLPQTTSSYDKLGPFKGIPLIIRAMAAGIQQSPALPAKFWVDAEKQHEEEVATQKLEEQRNQYAPVKLKLNLPDSIPVSIGLTPNRMVNVKKGLDDMANEWSKPSPSWIDMFRNRAFLNEFIRSWVVILVFALGAGLAPQVELLLRPIDYPNSRTYKQDIKLSIFMVALLAFACAVARVR